MQATVVKATSTSSLNEKINQVLSNIGDDFVDLKLSGAFNGSNDTFVAVILHK